MRILQLILWGFLLAYAAFALYVFFFADGLIFLPPAVDYAHEPAKDPSAVNLLTGDGNVIAARYLAQAPTQAPTQAQSAQDQSHNQKGYTILYSHGNASNLATIAPILNALHSQGFAVLAYDYPGYGHSSGRPTEAGAYNAIEVAYSYLTDTLAVPPEKIILHGHSLGGGPSLYLASKKKVAGVILESTFTSIFQVVVPVRILPFEKFPNIRRIRKLKCPLLLIHGRQDSVIPFSHSEALLAAAIAPKTLVAIAEADHNDNLWIDPETYLSAIRSFADKLN